MKDERHLKSQNCFILKCYFIKKTLLILFQKHERRVIKYHLPKQTQSSVSFLSRLMGIKIKVIPETIIMQNDEMILFTNDFYFMSFLCMMQYFRNTDLYKERFTSYMNGLVVIPSFFNLSLNLEIKVHDLSHSQLLFFFLMTVQNGKSSGPQEGSL